VHFFALNDPRSRRDSPPRTVFSAGMAIDTLSPGTAVLIREAQAAQDCPIREANAIQQQVK